LKRSQSKTENEEMNEVKMKILNENFCWTGQKMTMTDNLWSIVVFKSLLLKKKEKFWNQQVVPSFQNSLRHLKSALW